MSARTYLQAKNFTVDSVLDFATLPVTDINNALVVVSSFSPTITGSRMTYFYDASEAKANHDGYSIISPTVPWDGTVGTIAAFEAGTGETDGAGSGCWKLVEPIKIVSDKPVLNTGNVSKTILAEDRINQPNGVVGLDGSGNTVITASNIPSDNSGNSFIATNQSATNDEAAGRLDAVEITATNALARANHTGTQTASTISDFDTEVSNNASVVANTAKVSADGSVTSHSDVTDAGSGIIISDAERTKLAGIAPGATAGIDYGAFNNGAAPTVAPTATAAGSLSFGENASNADADSIVMGTNAQANAGTGAAPFIVLGKDASDTSGSFGNTVIGHNATNTVGHSSVIIGNGSAGSAGIVVAIGRATVSATQAVGIGTVTVSGINAIGIGDSVNSTDNGTIAIGQSSNATQADAISIGTLSDATGAAAIAIGDGSQGTAARAISIGNLSNASANDSISIGPSSTAAAAEVISIGHNATTQAANDRVILVGADSSFGAAFCQMGINIGYDNVVTGNLNTILGSSIGTITQSNQTLVGANITCNQVGAVVVGANSSATGRDCVVAGQGSTSGEESVSIGQNTTAGVESVTIGHDASGTGEGTVVIGFGASSSNLFGIAIGEGASAAASSVCIGRAASSTGGTNVVIARDATCSGGSSVVIGESSNSSFDNTVVVGRGCDSAWEGQAVVGSAVNSNTIDTYLSTARNSNTIITGVTTTDATLNSTLINVAGTVTAPIYFFEVDVVCVEDSTGEVWHQKITGMLKYYTATLSLVGSTQKSTIISSGGLTLTADVTVSGTNLSIDLTGEAAKTLDWDANVRVFTSRG